jgi:hypothetical protein
MDLGRPRGRILGPVRATALAALLVVGGAVHLFPSSSPGAEGPCTAAQTRSLVYAFARAWSRGDVDAVDRLVAPKPQFKWVSTGRPGSRFSPAAGDRSSLRAYILRRHAKHDRLVMRSFKFNGSDLRGTDGFGHFQFAVMRHSDDWPDGLAHKRQGKGAIVCTLPTPAIAVWSLG